MWLFAAWCIRRAGGEPLRITPQDPNFRAPLEGLILGGGSDLDAKLYGETRKELKKVLSVKHIVKNPLQILEALLVAAARWLFRVKEAPEVDRPRDEIEIAHLKRALQEGLPVLGICRGEQLLNVYFGGSLHQDLAGFYIETPELRSIFPRKRVDLVPDSRLAQILGATQVRVNALHRQGVDRLGDGLRITGRDRNGLVQAIEVEQAAFIIGVQWHPEFMPQIPQQQRLFRELVREAHNRRRLTEQFTAELAGVSLSPDESGEPGAVENKQQQRQSRS